MAAILGHSLFRKLRVVSMTVLLLSCLTTYSNGQSNCAESDKQNPKGIVAHETVNVFYHGIKNPISVAIPGHCPEDIQVSIKLGMVIYKDSGRFTVEVPPDIEETTLNIAIKTDSGLKRIDQKVFKVRKIPHPVPTLAGKRSGVVKLAELKAADSLKARNQEHLIVEGVHYEIAKYRWTYVPDSGKMQSGHHQGPAIDSVLNTHINEAKPGAKFMFDGLIAKGPDGRRKLPAAITLTVK